MKGEGRENIFFILVILIMLIMTVIYFTVPERLLFLENQLEWWKEFIEQ